MVHNGFIAGPAVSDGMIGSGKATMEMFCTGVSRLSKMFVNIEKHCAQQVSKVSEWLSKMVYCRAARLGRNERDPGNVLHRRVQIVQNVC